MSFKRESPSSGSFLFSIQLWNLSETRWSCMVLYSPTPTRPARKWQEVWTLDYWPQETLTRSLSTILHVSAMFYSLFRNVKNFFIFSAISFFCPVSCKQMPFFFTLLKLLVASQTGLSLWNGNGNVRYFSLNLSMTSGWQHIPLRIINPSNSSAISELQAAASKVTSEATVCVVPTFLPTKIGKLKPSLNL